MPAVKRCRAGANPDAITVVETGREIDGRVPNRNERQQILFLLSGCSEHAVACLEEMDSFFSSFSAVECRLVAAGPSERSRLAQDAWFSGYALAKLLFTFGVGRKSEKSAELPFCPRVVRPRTGADHPYLDHPGRYSSTEAIREKIASRT